MFAVMHSVQTDQTLLDIATICGVRSGLELCLDAGDINSVPVGTATWDDVSGNGRNYEKIGTCTFTGTRGLKDSGTYWSFGTNSHFGAVTTPTTWDDDLHKTNGQFSVVCVSYHPSSNSGSVQGLWGNTVLGGSHGIWGSIETSDQFDFAIGTTSGVLTNTVEYDKPIFHGVSWHQADDDFDALASNGNEVSNSASFASSANDPSANFTVAATRDNGTGRRYILNGGRMFVIAAWSKTIDLTTLYTIRRFLMDRYPTMGV